MLEISPHYVVAASFMGHKGYPGIEPYDVEKLDDEPCWYFLYRLPEGVLELEVYWNGGTWETLVTTFQVDEVVPNVSA